MSESTPNIRPAVASDGPALLELTRQTPMDADISLRIDREPDFFALTRARGAGQVWVAEIDGRAVACVSCVRRRAKLPDGIAEIGVLADLKVHPEHRRQGLAQALLEAIAAHEEQQTPAVYIGQTAEGNDAVDGVAVRFGTTRSLRPLARMTSYQLLTMPGLARPPAVDMREATDADLDAIEQVLASYYADHVLCPPFGAGALAEDLERTGMPVRCLRVAEVDGRIVAAVAAWEPEQLKQTRVTAMPAGLRALSATCRTLSGVLPLPHLPQVGQPLRFTYLRYPGHLPGHEPALKALVVDAVAEARRAKQHFCLLTCSDGDPLHGLVRGLPRTTFRYRVSAGIAHPSMRAALDTLTGRQVYDDACLS